MRGERRQYDYQPSYDDAAERAENKGSSFDSILKDSKLFVAEQGANLIRILPPGWKGAKHYGYKIRIHRNVGPRNQAYLCLRENKDSPYKRCPICEALYELGSKATQEDKRLLGGSDNIIFYVIERDKEKEGVKVWISSLTMDSDIAALSINRKNKSIINIVDPENGYDIEYVRRGKGLGTKYGGLQIMRESSPLSDSEKQFDSWLDVVFERPLPSILNFYKPERIEEVFYGKAKEEDEEGDDRPRGKLRDSVQEDEPVEKLERRRETRSEDDKEEESSQRRRTRLQEDIDDEVPFDTKANGRTREKLRDKDEEEPRERHRSRIVEEEPEERLSRSRRRAEPDPEEEAEEQETRPSRARRSVEEPEERKSISNRRVLEEDEDPNAGARQRMRERLNRERD